MEDRAEKSGYQLSKELGEMKNFMIRVRCTKPGCNFSFTESTPDENLANAKKNSLGTGRVIHSKHKGWLVAEQA